MCAVCRNALVRLSISQDMCPGKTRTRAANGEVMRRSCRRRLIYFAHNIIFTPNRSLPFRSFWMDYRQAFATHCTFPRPLSLSSPAPSSPRRPDLPSYPLRVINYTNAGVGGGHDSYSRRLAVERMAEEKCLASWQRDDIHTSRTRCRLYLSACDAACFCHASLWRAVTAHRDIRTRDFVSVDPSGITSGKVDFGRVITRSKVYTVRITQTGFSAARFVRWKFQLRTMSRSDQCACVRVCGCVCESARARRIRIAGGNGSSIFWAVREKSAWILCTTFETEPRLPTPETTSSYPIQ